MPHIFFTVEVPPSEPNIIAKPPTNVSSGWREFEAAVDGSKTATAGKSRVTRNVWLLDAEGALPLLLELTALADKHGLLYKAFLAPGDVVAMSPKRPKSDEKSFYEN